MFCSSLPFSTLEHHWWHVQPLKLLANRLVSFALSPCIIGVKGRYASQLMSQRAPVPRSSPPNSHNSVGDGEIKQTEREIFSSGSLFFDLIDVFLQRRTDEAENSFSFLKN